MFNYKLKKEIHILTVRIWKLENPPKYKIGDKYSKDEIIVDIIFVESIYNFLFVTNPYYKYKILNTKTKSITTLTI